MLLIGIEWRRISVTSVQRFWRITELKDEIKIFFEEHLGSNLKKMAEEEGAMEMFNDNDEGN